MKANYTIFPMWQYVRVIHTFMMKRTVNNPVTYSYIRLKICSFLTFISKNVNFTKWMAFYQFIRQSTVTKFATVTPFTQELSPCTSQGGELGTRPTRWWWARLLRGQWSQTPGGCLSRGAGLSNPPPPTFPVHYAVSGEIKIGQNKYSCLFFAPLFFSKYFYLYKKVL